MILFVPSAVRDSDGGRIYLLGLAKRVYNYSMTNRVTNPRITKLEKNEIFVFGSNLAGMHGGGAAAAAMKRFGARLGAGSRTSGAVIPIPTMQGG